jgi:hypothetical protein
MSLFGIQWMRISSDNLSAGELARLSDPAGPVLDLN